MFQIGDKVLRTDYTIECGEVVALPAVGKVTVRWSLNGGGYSGSTLSVARLLPYTEQNVELVRAKIQARYRKLDRKCYR